jgi:hypothetical protein
MPQVAARINADQERWLKDYFRTKSAGVENGFAALIFCGIHSALGGRHFFSSNQ